MWRFKVFIYINYVVSHIIIQLTMTVSNWCVILFLVLLQPFAYNAAEKNKHKFMIQSVLMPEGSLKSPDELVSYVGPQSL